MSLKDVIERGNACVQDRDKIPGAPLWHLGKVAAVESRSSFDLMQNTVDYLTCKAKAERPFTQAEREFMKELFEALWWGGKYRGYAEAAMLADHYVNGDGKTMKLSPEVYQTSAIVTATTTAIKAYLRERSLNKKPIGMARSGDIDFLRSSYAADLRPGSRSAAQEDYLLKDGALLAEQNNARLKNTDNRFFLAVVTSAVSGGFVSRWSVDSRYDFEPFERGYVTDIPLATGMVLKLPDGLSHHLHKIGVAKEFQYTTEWTDRWE